MLLAGFPSPPQVTLSPIWGHIVVKSDGGSSLAVQTVIGHMKREIVGLPEVQHALPQNQVHAVASCGGGGGVQDQSVVLKRHGTPALRESELAFS